MFMHSLMTRAAYAPARMARCLALCAGLHVYSQGVSITVTMHRYGCVCRCVALCEQGCICVAGCMVMGVSGCTCVAVAAARRWHRLHVHASVRVCGCVSLGVGL